MDVEMGEMQTGGGPEGALPFIYGHVDPTLLPSEEIAAAAETALRQAGRLALNYGAEQGCGPLLAVLQAKLARDEGLDVPDDGLMLTVGASGGLGAVCRLFTRPGDTVLVEAPSYHEALDLLRDYPIRLAAVPLDQQGLVVPALAERLERLNAAGERPRMLYTIPTFQNPSGVTMAASRRRALLQLARRNDFLIVEDDVYRDLSFETPPPPSLYGLDWESGGGSVIRLGSFSKILAPGLRLGWLMGPPGHVARITSSGLFKSGGGANPFVAYVVAAYCRAGRLEPHVAHLRETYRHRRDVLLAALDDHMPEGVSWTRPGGGFYVWLTLPEGLTAAALLGAAQGITFLTGERFFAEGGGERHVRLPFSYIPPQAMAEGVRTLGGVIRRMAPGP